MSALPGMSHHSPHPGSMDARSSIFDKKMRLPDSDIWGDIVQDDVPVALTRIQLPSRLGLQILVLARFSQTGLVLLPLILSNR